MAGGTDKFKKGTHYCRTPVFGKSAGKTWRCKCGSVFRCKEYKGRLSWLMIRDGRK
jgi:hypothetical protein